jgi:methylated-DNA-[protein]-cysteine S-methyltransferase
MTQKQSPNRPLVHRMTIGTPIGTLLLEGTDEALTRIELPGSHLPGDVTVPVEVSTEAASSGGVVTDAAGQLMEYFAGDRKEFDIPLELNGTPFQREVWTALAEIPYGQTVSYAELAEMVGRPKAFRAVGQANGSNPIPIVLPCHRVVASGGSIGGYGGGVSTKRRLLALEGATWNE